MSGECNYCGGLHTEDGCDAPRHLVYDNGHSRGYSQGHNAQNERLEQIKSENAALREELAAAERRRGGECDTCGGWICPPLRCAACMMTKRLTPDSDPGPLAADAIRQQDKQLAALREAVQVLGEYAKARIEGGKNHIRNAQRGSGVLKEWQQRCARAREAIDANPLASAAVREAKEQA